MIAIVAPARAFPPHWRFDPRYGQMTAQCTLLLLVLLVLDFGPSPIQAGVYLTGTLSLEALRARLSATPFNWKSAVSTGLSLSLLLRAQDPAIWVAACVLAMGSKFLIRVNGKHLFNPSAFAIVALLLATPEVWVSPGQWGTRLWLAALVGSMGCLILSRVARLDISLAFLGTHAALLFVRAFRLGDPLAIPIHQLQSGGILIFSLFMLTDPRSTPDSRAARLIFGAAVAALAHVLMFHWQLREGVFYALIAVSCLTPVLDRLMPAPRFHWADPEGKPL